MKQKIIITLVFVSILCLTMPALNAINLENNNTIDTSDSIDGTIKVHGKIWEIGSFPLKPPIENALVERVDFKVKIFGKGFPIFGYNVLDQAYTDKDGEYKLFDVPDRGSLRIRISKPGYKTRIEHFNLIPVIGVNSFEVSRYLREKPKTKHIQQEFILEKLSSTFNFLKN